MIIYSVGVNGRAYLIKPFLEEVIIPLFYNDHSGWIRVMKNAIGKNAYYFNTHVMMRRYVTEAYLR